MQENLLRCSVGVIAYNEERRISIFLDSLLAQKLKRVQIQEIIVIASGCTDNTEKIIREYIKSHPQIRLILQPEREGKARAINLFLKHAQSGILVESSADIALDEEAIEKLVTAFLDPVVGMAGVHPIASNDSNTFIGFTQFLLWELHHRISLENPKLGEMVAFRNIIKEIPFNAAVDEAMLESMIIKRGYKLHYVPDAIVYTDGLVSIRGFLIQRRRIHAGHLWLKKHYNYKVSTRNVLNIMKALVKYAKIKPLQIPWIIGAAGLESVGWILGSIDFFLRKKNPFIWERIK